MDGCSRFMVVPVEKPDLFGGAQPEHGSPRHLAHQTTEGSFLATMEGRVINFAAGPAALPDSVLEKAQKEFLNWNVGYTLISQGSGMSVVEMSHRGKHFMSIFNKAKENLAKLLYVTS